MQRGRLVLSILLASLAAAWQVGCGKPSTPAEAASAEGAPRESLPKVVVTRPVRKPLILSTTQPARIEAYEQTPLYAKVAGYVDNVAVDIGDVVKKGDPLITLHVPELQNVVEQRQALLAQAQAEIAQAEAAELAARAAAETATAHV